MMSSGDIDGWRFLGRPVKPVAFGLALACFLLFFVNFTNRERFTEEWASDVMVLLGGMGFITLVLAWFFRSQHLAEVGLMATGAAFLMRAVFGALTVWPDISIFYSLSFVIVAWGAYMVERMSSDDSFSEEQADAP